MFIVNSLVIVLDLIMSRFDLIEKVAQVDSRKKTSL